MTILLRPEENIGLYRCLSNKSKSKTVVFEEIAELTPCSRTTVSSAYLHARKLRGDFEFRSRIALFINSQLGFRPWSDEAEQLLSSIIKAWEEGESVWNNYAFSNRFQAKALFRLAMATDDRSCEAWGQLINSYQFFMFDVFGASNYAAPFYGDSLKRFQSMAEKLVKWLSAETGKLPEIEQWSSLMKFRVNANVFSVNWNLLPKAERESDRISDDFARAAKRQVRETRQVYLQFCPNDYDALDNALAISSRLGLESEMELLLEIRPEIEKRIKSKLPEFSDQQRYDSDFNRLRTYLGISNEITESTILN